MSRDLTPLPSAAAFFALPQPGPCDTDADAYDWLPPFLLARNTYDGLRSEGMVPSAAFHETLLLWREFMQECRP